MIDADRAGDHWSGGLYYAANIYYVLSCNEYISQNYEVIIFCGIKQKKLLAELIPGAKRYVSLSERSYVKKIEKLILCLLKQVKIVYWGYSDYPVVKTKAVSWIPDFQHKYYQQYFSTEEITNRDETINNISQDGLRKLVLSSEDSMKDFIKFFGQSKAKTYVVPFVSYIEEVISKLSEKSETIILKKYALERNCYVCIMNQFWQHKNHIVVFEAIEKLYNLYPKSNLIFVFTGIMEDYRNQSYIEQLKQIARDPIVDTHIKILGFIDRKEQIAIMKNAAFVIQPSLFEGWGTVVEDAKVLDKTILLSDIPVHHEQMNEKCILFDPHDPVALADLIYQESQKEHHDDVGKGIADMYKRAKEYSKGFEQLLRDLEIE